MYISLFFLILLFNFNSKLVDTVGVFEERLRQEIAALEAEIEEKRLIDKKLNVKLREAGICFPKQPVDNLINLANDFEMAFYNEYAETGAVVIPDKRLVVCSYPKAGSSTAKWIILALLGYKDKTGFCGNVEELHSNHDQFLTRGVQYVRTMPPPTGHYNGPKDFTCFANNSLNIIDQWKDVPNYYLDPSWTTVAFTRDPWYRVVSMYHDQMKRDHLPKRWRRDSKQNFTTFVKSYTTIRGRWSEGFQHTGDAVKYCGLKHVEYDHYVDVDNIGLGLKKIIEARPDLESYLTTGWENCTHDNDPSLITGKVKQPHQSDDYKENAERRKKLHDSWFCDNETRSQIYHRYFQDYFIYRHKLNYTVHTCLM